MPSVSAYAGSVSTGFDTGGGTVNWSNTSNAIGSPTGSYASISGMGGSATTKSIDLYNFNPGVPGGATINGCVITIQAFNSTKPVTISSANLYINGVQGSPAGGTSANGDSLTGTATTYTWGTSTDLWGISSGNWTAALVNGSTEGTDLTFCVWFHEGPLTGGGVSINGIQATVYYTAGAGGVPTGSMPMFGGIVPLNNLATGTPIQVPYV